MLFSNIRSSISGAPTVTNDLHLIRDIFLEVKTEYNSVSKFYDLGSGYGDILFLASTILHPKEIIGIEIASFPSFISYLKTYKHRSKDTSYKIINSDILKTDFSDGEIIYIYLLPDLLKKLECKVNNVISKNPNVCIISPVFKFPNLKPKKVLWKYHSKFKKQVEIYIY